MRILRVLIVGVCLGCGVAPPPTGLVVSGPVQSVQSEWTANQFGDQQIVTWVTINPVTVVQGSYPFTSIRLRYLGGTAEGFTMQESHADVLPTVGQTVTVTIVETPDGYAPVRKARS